jgi:TonB family protein
MMKPRVRSLALLMLLGPPLSVCSLLGQEAPTPTTPPSLPAPRPDTSGTYRPGHGVSAPRLVFQREAEFSDEARRKHVTGNCMVALVVDVDGHVKNVRVVRSAADGQPEKLKAAAQTLDDKAIEAVKQYRFEPAMFEGRPVPVALNVEVNFKLF